MPQIFQVLRCYKCLVFQVHQTKKSNKWQCKLCAEKQSVKRHYGIGTGKESRLHVQKLNALRGEIDENIKCMATDTDDEDTFSEGDKININEENKNNNFRDNSKKKESKWSEYIEKAEEETSETLKKDSHLDNIKVVLEMPKRKRKFKCLRSTTDSSKLSENASCETTKFNTKASETIKKNESYSSNIIFPADDVTCRVNDFFDKTINAEPNPKVNKKVFKVPIVKDNSKWAQFVKDEDTDDQSKHFDENNFNDFENKDNFDVSKYVETADEKFIRHTDKSFDNKEIVKNVTNEKGSILFELCDDGELDSVLDI